MQIEQAIYTSARTRRMDGYQLAAASPGISRQQARELSHWCPAHDSLLDNSQHQGASVNFHPLDEEAMCVSQTVIAGAEYSGRGGGRIYTQCFIMSPQALNRFAGNPFRLLEAIVGAGHVAVLDEIPDRLETISLIGRASVLNRRLLDRLLATAGAETLTRLLDGLLTCEILGAMSQHPAKMLFAGLLNVLPVECRAEVSFSTGLKHSQSRPFRLISLPENSLAIRRSRRSTEPQPMHLDHEPTSLDSDPHPWTELVAWHLAHNKISQLASLLETPRPGLCLDLLDSLGKDLLPKMTIGRGGY